MRRRWRGEGNGMRGAGMGRTTRETCEVKVAIFLEGLGQSFTRINTHKELDKVVLGGEIFSCSLL